MTEPNGLHRDNVAVLIPALNEVLRIREVVQDALAYCPHVIVVDDGLATGSTMRAAVAVLQLRGAERIVVAVPVGAEDAVRGLLGRVSDVVCLLTPPAFEAVGQWYRDFTQTTEEECEKILHEARRREAHPEPGGVRIPIPGGELAGEGAEGGEVQDEVADSAGADDEDAHGGRIANRETSTVGAVYDRARSRIVEHCAVIDRAYSTRLIDPISP